MVVILACLSLILTAGGGAMALYGADLIRSESGLALTQSGITMLSAGLVLAGLTTAVVELRRMRRLMEIEEPLGLHHVAPPPPPPPPPPVQPDRSAPSPDTSASRGAVSPDQSPAPSPPASFASAPSAGGTPAEPMNPVHEGMAPVEGDKKASSRTSSKPPLPPLPPMGQARRQPGSGIPAEARAGLVGIAAGRGSKPAEPATAPAGADTVTGDGPVHESNPVPPAASVPSDGEAGAVAELPEGSAAGPATSPHAGQLQDPSHGTLTSSERLPDGTGEAEAATGERKMLATYNSGGITYFMFSDGSIEANMAGGRHRFTSMDELRGYIDTGKGGVLVEPGPAPAQPSASA